MPPSMMKPKVLPPAARDVTSATPNSDQSLRSFSALDKTDARYVREHNETTLTTTQGKVVIDDLDVPEDVKQLLFDLDFDYSGEVSKEELKDMCTHLTQLHAELGAGSSNAKITELLELITRQVNRKKNNASFMEYSHLPEKLQKCFKVWDIDKDGRVDAHELMAAADAWQKLQKESAFMKKLLLAACIVVVLMFAGMFVMGMVTAEMAKEFKAGGSGVNPKMTSKSGDTIQVASSDTQTDESGVLLTRAVLANSTSGRNLLGAGAATVATQAAKTKQRLVSTLPDSFFDALNEVKVYSEKGHTLSLKIQGYARTPLKNSRCGNVLKMYTSVDGAIVLDSSDMSFEDKLHDLFKNAGFEVAVGGAAGRRLANSASVDGFFDHVSKMESEGSWKCGDIPLPQMPAYHIKKFDSYTPCIEPKPESVTQLFSSCDSVYGGKIVDAAKLPAEHATATLSRLDKVQDTVINGKIQDPTADKLYRKTSEFSIVSPAYTVQRTSYAMHPAQDIIQVTDLNQKKSVTFQQMHSGSTDSAVRNFCRSQGVVDPVLKEKEGVKDPSHDTSVHFEYVGLESEGAKTYRRFRLIPSKDFSAWMGSEGVGKTPNTVYHYWDDADSDSFTPFRLVTPGGDVVVYTEVSQIATDEEAEVFLKNTVNSTKFGIFAKPYKLECDETEKGPSSADFGTVPEMNGGELSPDDINFYARYLFDASRDAELLDGSDTGDAASLSQAVRNGEDKELLLSPVYTYLGTITKKSRNFGFVQHALLAHGKLSMASVCSTPCAAERNAVQVHMTENANGAMCSALSLKPLVECLESLDSQIFVYCMQSIFWSNYQTTCVVVPEKKTPQNRRLQAGQAEMHQLPDGTHSLDLGSLDQQTKMHLSGGISASQQDASLGDLNGYVLLYNASNMEKPTGNALLSSWESETSADSSTRSLVSRRLIGAKDCRVPGVSGFCIQFTFPKPGNARCLKACSSNTLMPVPPARCESEIVNSCSLSLKVKVVPPYWATGPGSGGTPASTSTSIITTSKVCANQEWANCNCRGKVYYGRKFRSSRPPGYGQTTDLAALKSKGLRFYMWLRVSGSIQCDYRTFMGPDTRGGRRLDGGEEGDGDGGGGGGDQDPMREWTNYCICEYDETITTVTPAVGPSNSYGGTWTISVELGGSIAILEKMFGIFSPPSPLYGNALMSGGIIFSNKASCPDIPFYLEGWASIGFAAGVDIWIKKLDLFMLSLKVGAKTVSATAKGWRTRTDRRRCFCFGSRRREDWRSHFKAATCDVEVYARIDAQVSVIKGWLLLQYFINDKLMKINLGVQAHVDIWPLSFCKDIWQKDVYHAKIR